MPEAVLGLKLQQNDQRLQPARKQHTTLEKMRCVEWKSVGQDIYLRCSKLRGNWSGQRYVFYVPRLRWGMGNKSIAGCS